LNLCVEKTWDENQPESNKSQAADRQPDQPVLEQAQVIPCVHGIPQAGLRRLSGGAISESA
jgi:hypothetical protein